MPRIVEIKDQSPLLVRPEDTANGVVAVCRCGLSSNWPYCTGAHKFTRGEDPQKLYHYDRELPQGEPKRHEIDLEAVERDWRQQVEAQGTPPPTEGAGAAQSRPPRPAAGGPAGHEAREGGSEQRQRHAQTSR